MPDETHDPIDAAAKAGRHAAAEHQAELDAVEEERAAAAAERRQERARGPQAVELSDDGMTITIRHTAGKVLQSSPLGILMVSMALLCFYGALQLVNYAQSLSMTEATGARTMYIISAIPCALVGAAALFLWIRAGARPSLVIRVTDEGNVGLLSKDKLVTVGRGEHFYVSIIRRARVWGRVRWVGKCSVSALGKELTGPNVYGRRVFGVTEGDVSAIRTFARRHGIQVRESEFSSTTGERSYEDRGLWAA